MKIAPKSQKDLPAEAQGFLKRLAAISIPIIMQESLGSLVNMVDNFMVGSLGLHAVTAVGLANLVFFLYAVVLFGVCSGAAIYIGQFWGKNDVKNIHKSIGLAWLNGLLLAVVVTMAVIFAAPQIMGFYSEGDTQVIAFGVEYLHAVAPAYLLIACVATINISMRAIGMTRLPLFSTAIGLLCNIVFNALFIYVLEMGVTGAAIATVIARTAELCVQLFLVRHYNIPILGPVRNYFAFNREFVKKFYILIIPVVLNEFLWALGTMLYSVIYKATGTEGQGAAQIASTVQNIFMVIGMSSGSGVAVMIANALGAGDRDRAISYSRKSMIMAVCISIIMGAALAVLAPLFIGIYKVPELVKDYAYKICLVIATGMIVRTVNFTAIIGVLRSGGDTKFCLIIDGLTVWLIGLPLLLIGAYIYHLPIYLLVAITYTEEIVKLLFTLRRVFSNCWAQNVVENM